MPKQGKKGKGRQVKQGSKKKKEPSVKEVAEQIRELTKSEAETTEDSGVFDLANGLSEKTLTKESKEAYFIKEILYILKSVKRISSVRTEQNTLELQLRLKKKLACARLQLEAQDCPGKLAKVLLLGGQKWVSSQHMHKILTEGVKDDKDEFQKMLTTLWTLAKTEDTLSGPALNAHEAILQLLCTREENGDASGDRPEATPSKKDLTGKGDKGKARAIQKLDFGSSTNAKSKGSSEGDESTDSETMPRKAVILSVCRPSNHGQPKLLEDLSKDQPYDKENKWAVAQMHRGDCDPDTVSKLLRDVARKEFARMTLTLVSPTEYQQMIVSAVTDKTKARKQRRVVKEFLENFPTVLVAESAAYIAVHSGDGYRPLKGKKQYSLGKLEEHPMFNDIAKLSKIASGCSKKKENAIYVALLYMNETPAYYVGKASGGIEDRWHDSSSSHCKDINKIIHILETQPNGIEAVVQNQPCDLAVAVAVKQMAKKKAYGVALFAVDFCPDGTMNCCFKHGCRRTPKAIDHYEQHYMNALETFYPDSDTEGGTKMLCLNVKKSSKHHENPHDCSSEVALSLLLHSLQGRPTHE